MSSAFEVRVFGDLTVRRDGEPVALTQSRKTRALLAYLAVQQKQQRREWLCEMFWDVPDDPRGALRWSLSKLRQILNADGETRLAADRNVVQLKPGSIWLDYDLIRGLSADAVGSLPTERLEAIAAAFAGPFLSDLYLPRCQAFEAWRVYCSNETEILHLKALRALIDRLGDEPERALPHLHTLQSLLPDNDLADEIARINDQARLTVAAAPIRSGTTAGPVSRPAPEPQLTGPVPEPVPSPSTKVSSGKQQIRYVNARDGTRIAYVISGSGPAIVRASHWMSHLDFDWESPVWGHWIDGLSSGFTLVRYDGRLNGLSDTVCEDVSFDAFVDDLECVVEAVGLDRFVLLGISQGCALSVEYAIRHPEKVAGLLIWGGYVRGWRARGNAAEIVRREAISALMRQGWGQDDPLFRQMFTNLFIPGANRVQMDWFNELQRRTLTPENAMRLSYVFADIDISRSLERLHVPALVLHANGDRVAPFSEGLELARSITGARFVELESANHILLAEEPAFRNFILEASAFANEALQAQTVVAVDPRTRRQATILCADFQYAEPVMENLPPDVALERVDPFLMQATALVRDNGGTVLTISENELVASFGAPEPLEGHAALACRTALALRQLALRHGDWMTGVRAALDTGVVIVSPARDGALEVRGGPVSVAHTLSQALGRDLVVATARTRASAGGFVSMEALAAPLLSEYPKNQRLFEVIEIRRGRSRWQLRAETQLSPFVGREMQLQILNKAWHDVFDGEGQTVFVVGDPGHGKSRVTHEFVGAIPHDDAENLEAGALETDLRSGFVVIRKLLQTLFGVGDTEAPPIAIEKVLAAQSAQGFDERLLDPIMAVMELPVQDPNWAIISGQERSRRMQEAAVGLLLFLGRRKPVVLLVEDLHWIDAESEGVLVRLAQALPTVRCLLILTCRPEYDRGAFAAAGPSEIRLPAFNTAEAAAFLDYLVGRDPELAQLRGAVGDACKGNALFLEETVRALAETGKLEGQPGRYRPSGEVDEIVVSASIQTIVDARFERLDKDSKRVAEVASIFGGEIPVPLLRRMATLSSLRFDAALQNLKKADLLVELQVFPEAFVRFKHVLIRTAVSGRIVSSALIELHRTALAELKAHYADRLEEHSERLARHAQQAHLWVDAVGYLLISARKAIRRSAHVSALEQLDLGVRLLRSNDVADADEQEIEFQLARGVALMAARGWGATEVLAAFERAEELCGKIGDQARLFTALRGRAQYYMLSGKPAAAQELACRWAGMAKDDSDPGLTIETEHMFWTNNFFLGETAAAQNHAERAIGLYDPDRDHYLTYKYSGHDPGVCCRCFSGLSAWLAGEPDKARLRCEDATGLAGRFEHPLSMALAYWGTSYLHMFAGEPEAALRAAESELQIAEKFQLPLLVGQAAFQVGWGQFRLGERGAGLRGMEEAISAIRRTGAEMGLPYLIGLYAEALGDSGRLDSARKSVEAALELGRYNGTYFQLAEVLRIEACIREKSGGGPDEIEKMLHKAANVATLQRSAIGQLRIAVELARCLRSLGDVEKAREFIAPHGELVGKLDDSQDARAAREFF
ncbi:alpha/beta fold hydrolase [Mesorhizobium sp.]|uniref:alpha/beta fold hydrolase n=1 Tax=Mesorhizobium sp. TaxID=1871066 RepID=UPI000FEA6EC1|nr:alpha/beta fold hydrolase [Mesorhizobium sp.]RWE60805.1 MAG: alpha/beta fold hydrolase [Mesorhizobium sp.]